MIIDDDRQIRKIYETFLRKAGFDVILATSGEEALEVLQTSVPDLILLDVQMQGMDGFQTIAAIRKRKNLLNIPIFFLTSAADPAVKSRGMDLEADDYLYKTTPLNELVDRINAFLRDRAMQKQTGGVGVVRGDLSENPLHGILQEIARLKKDAWVAFKDMEADIYVESGQIVHARRWDFTGEQALTRIFFEPRGAYKVAYGPVPKDIPRNPVPLMSTLITLSTYVDEVMGHVKRLQLNDKSVSIDFELAEYNDFKEFRDKSPMSCVDLLLRMRGGLKQNLKALVDGIKEKDLFLMPGAPCR